MKYLVALFLITMVLVATLSNAEEDASISTSTEESTGSSESSQGDSGSQGESSEDEEDRRKRDASPEEEEADIYIVDD